jgi:ATP adenylyltransferase/5',5'''-P-1,P-4-tetraphosphate phosphorylase II
MSWIPRLLSDTALAPYGTPGAGAGLPARVAALLAQQNATWPTLRAGTVALATAQYRSLQVNGSEVIAQYNPQRLGSTAAQVDATSIRTRRCFLCTEHLPLEERGLAWGDDFVILCNPFPILPNHLVIAARDHIPQAIVGSYGTLLDLAAALGEAYWVLYNGPACGASAPDHLHLQAGTQALLPILHEVEHWPHQQVVQHADQEVFALTGYRLQVLIARGSKRSTLLAWLQQAVAVLAAVTRASNYEPLLNLLVTWATTGWTVYVFPRARHRPACYFAEGEAKLTVSPAALDLAGVLVVPDAGHFTRIQAQDIARIYAEVTLDTPRFAQWMEQCRDHACA